MAVFFPERQKQVGLNGVEITPTGILKLAVVPPPPPPLPSGLPLGLGHAPSEMARTLSGTRDARLERTRDPQADRTVVPAPLPLERVEATRSVEPPRLQAVPPAPLSDDALEFADPLIGATLEERYRIGEFIGAGSMGRVYKGLQIAVGRTVAVKVINGLQVKDEASIHRFQREARVQAQMTHPNIVHLFDFGRHEDTIYLVMEHISGRSLQEVIRQGAPFVAPRAAGLMVQLLRALAAAHGRGVVHRDLKPANLLIMTLDDGREVLKVADFGLALQSSGVRSLPSEGGLVGSPRYMSPEQAAAGTATAASDIYSFGAVLYEMLTGEYANPGRTAVEVMRRQRGGPPARPELEDSRATWMLDLALECLATAPDERPSSAVELLTRLEEAGVVAPRCQQISADSSPIITDPELVIEVVTDPELAIEVVELDAPDSLLGWPDAELKAAVTRAEVIRKTSSQLPVVELMATLIVAALVWVGLDFVERMEADRAAELQASSEVMEAPSGPIVTGDAAVVAAPTEVRSVSVVTRPRGALVLSGAQVLGITPLEVKWPADEPAPTLMIRATGRQDTVLDLAAEAELSDMLVLDLPTP